MCLALLSTLPASPDSTLTMTHDSHSPYAHYTEEAIEARGYGLSPRVASWSRADLCQRHRAPEAKRGVRGR